MQASKRSRAEMVAVDGAAVEAAVVRGDRVCSSRRRNSPIALADGCRYSHRQRANIRTCVIRDTASRTDPQDAADLEEGAAAAAVAAAALEDPQCSSRCSHTEM